MHLESRVVVVGSGLSAVGAIRALISKGIKPLVLDIGALFVEIGVARGPSSSSSVSSPAAFLGVVLRRCCGSFCSGGSDEGAGLGAAAAARLWRARFAGGMERTAGASWDS